jgi:TPR repeat protein
LNGTAYFFFDRDKKLNICSVDISTVCQFIDKRIHQLNMSTTDERTQYIKTILDKFYAGDDFATQQIYNLVRYKDYFGIIKYFIENNSDDKSIALLGYIYILDEEYKKAQILLEDACALGNLNSFSSLALMYINGHGFRQNYDKAKIMFEKALLSNCPHAHYRLGTLYLNGKGVDQDEHKALECFKESCKRGCSMAYMKIRDMYDENKIDKSVFDQLYNGEHAMVYEKLAGEYRYGYRVVKDEDRAIKLYEKAHKIDKYCGALKSIYEIHQKNKDYPKMLEIYSRAKIDDGYDWSDPMMDYFVKLYEENQEIRKLAMAGVATGRCDVIFANIMDKI